MTDVEARNCRSPRFGTPSVQLGQSSPDSSIFFNAASRSVNAQEEDRYRRGQCGIVLMQYSGRRRATSSPTCAVTSPANPGAGRNVTTTEPLSSVQTGEGLASSQHQFTKFMLPHVDQRLPDYHQMR